MVTAQRCVSGRASRLLLALLVATAALTPAIAHADQLEVTVSGKPFASKSVVEAFRVAANGPDVLKAGGFDPKGTILFRHPNSNSAETAWSSYDGGRAFEVLVKAGFPKGLNVRLHYVNDQAAAVKVVMAYLRKSRFVVSASVWKTPNDASAMANKDANSGLAVILISVRRGFTQPSLGQLNITRGEFAQAQSLQTPPTPDLRKLRPEEVNNRYPDIKFQVRVRGEKQASLAPGLIVDQDPIPGLPMPTNGVIGVWLSTRKSDDVNLPTPDLRGLTTEIARSRYREFRIEPTVVGTVPSKLARGLIAEQRPGPTENLPPDRQIKVWLSAASPMQVVPDLSGFDWDRAEATAKASALGIGHAGGIESSKYPKGTVAQQSPQPGEKLPRGGTVKVWLSAGPPMQIVPDLSGLDWNRAAAAAKASALGIGNAGEIESSKYPNGTVAQQSPQPGEKLPRGGTVKVWLSAGPPMQIIPDLSGLDWNRAAAAAKASALGIGHAGGIESSKYPKGTVAQQSPQPGEKLPRGGTVKVWLSAGPPMQIVPDLSGLDWNRAAAAAKASALGIGNAGKIESSKYPNGTVAQQSPQAGEKLLRGGTVTVWLSMGPPLIPVPHVIGMTEAEAAKLLQRTELRLRIDGEDYSSEQPEDRIYWQDPVENSQRSAGSIVRVKISRGEEPGPWWQLPIALAAGAGLLLTAGYAIGKTINRKPGEKKGGRPTRPKISVRRKGADSEQEIEIEGDVSAVGSALRLRAVPDRGEQEIAKIDNNKEE